MNLVRWICVKGVSWRESAPPRAALPPRMVTSAIYRAIALEYIAPPALPAVQFVIVELISLTSPPIAVCRLFVVTYMAPPSEVAVQSRISQR